MPCLHIFQCFRPCLPLPGLQHCTINVHLLSHLPFYVRHYGPLWTHSAFVFEDGIGHLLRKAHGTHDIGRQVCTFTNSISTITC